MRQSCCQTSADTIPHAISSDRYRISQTTRRDASCISEKGLAMTSMILLSASKLGLACKLRENVCRAPRSSAKRKARTLSYRWVSHCNWSYVPCYLVRPTIACGAFQFQSAERNGDAERERCSSRHGKDYEALYSVIGHTINEARKFTWTEMDR